MPGGSKKGGGLKVGSAYKMKGSTLYGSPMNRKGPIGDWIKKTRAKIGKWWDPRTDAQKQKETEAYAYKSVAHDIERGEYSSLPQSHRKAIEKIMNQ
jgi:hypothetical protein